MDVAELKENDMEVFRVLTPAEIDLLQQSPPERSTEGFNPTKNASLSKLYESETFQS